MNAINLRCGCENGNNCYCIPDDSESELIDLLVEKEVFERFVGGVKTAFEYQGLLTAKKTVLGLIETLESGKIHEAVRAAKGLN
jgi:hypothetical protein